MICITVLCTLEHINTNPYSCKYSKLSSLFVCCFLIICFLLVWKHRYRSDKAGIFLYLPNHKYTFLGLFKKSDNFLYLFFVSIIIDKRTYNTASSCKKKFDSRFSAQMFQALFIDNETFGT